jgi:hypothetical protein
VATELPESAEITTLLKAWGDGDLAALEHLAEQPDCAPQILSIMMY